MTLGIAHSVDEQIVERIRIHGWTFMADALAVGLAYLLATGVRYNGHVPSAQWQLLVLAIPLAMLVHSLLNYIYRIHRRVWKYANIRDIKALIESSATSVVVLGALDVLIPTSERLFPISVVLAGGAFSLLALALVRVGPRLKQAKMRSSGEVNRILIVGAGEGGQLVAISLLGNPQWCQQPIGFVDDDPRKRKMSIHGLSVLGVVEDLRDIVRAHRVDTIGIAIPSATSLELDRIVAIAQETAARIQILPSHAEIMAGDRPMRLHDISLDDLLERAPSSVALDTPHVQKTIAGQVVLVTGARGSIGLELCRQMLRLKPAKVLALDNNETGLFYLERELKNDPNAGLLTLVLADITDEDKLSHVFRRYQPDVVFHAAAYKHVPLLESHPEEAVFVNVQGTMNLCRMATEFQCERFVFISTDKAVEPANVLGFSKRIGELVVRAHGQYSTVFCSVRFGNVVGSRGSALPEFIHQIDAGGPVCVTHPDVERYFMTIPESVSLVIQAAAFARGGELFMLDMGEPLRIGDLVKRIIRLRGLRIGKDIEIIYTGLRPGEKMTEELVFEGEHAKPTDNPLIFLVEDESEPELHALHRRITSLLQLARLGDAELVRSALAELAHDEGFQPTTHRLRSLTSAVERSLADVAAHEGQQRTPGINGRKSNVVIMERRSSRSDRRSGSDRRVGLGGWMGPERRKSGSDQRFQEDRRAMAPCVAHASFGRQPAS